MKQHDKLNYDVHDRRNGQNMASQIIAVFYFYFSLLSQNFFVKKIFLICNASVQFNLCGLTVSQAVL